MTGILMGPRFNATADPVITVENFSPASLDTAGIRLGADGSINQKSSYTGGVYVSAVPPMTYANWITPQVMMGNYEVRATLVRTYAGGTMAGAGFGPAWIDLAAGALWELTHTGAWTTRGWTIEIRRKGTIVILGSAYLELIAGP